MAAGLEQVRERSSRSRSVFDVLANTTGRHKCRHCNMEEAARTMHPPIEVIEKGEKVKLYFHRDRNGCDAAYRAAREKYGA